MRDFFKSLELKAQKVLPESLWELGNEPQVDLGLFVNVLPYIGWVMDTRGLVNFCNKHWQEYSGFTQEQSKGEGWLSAIHSEDIPHVKEILKKAKSAGGADGVECRIKSKAGEYNWFLLQATPLQGGDGKIYSWLWTATNINNFKLSENELKKSRNELNAILSEVAEGITLQDRTGKIIYANAAASKLIGLPSPGDVMAKPAESIVNQFSIFNEEGAPLDFSSLPGRLVLQGKPANQSVLQFRQNNTSQVRWAVVKSSPVKDSEGNVIMALTIFQDITQERQNELVTRRAHQRQKFLTEAGKVLSESLDYEITLKKIAELVVPEIADWAAVDILDESGGIKRLAVVHKDPEKIKLAYELEARNPYDPNSPTGLAKVMRSGEPDFYPVITEEMLVAGALDEEHLKVIKALGLTSVIVVPLKIQNKILGAITLVSAESGINFSEEDLSLAQELVRQASLAIQNSLLYGEAKQAAIEAQNQSQLMDTLLGNAPAGFSFVDTELKYVRVNNFFADIYGVDPKECLGKKIYEVLPLLAETLVPIYEKVMQTGQPILGLEINGFVTLFGGKTRDLHTSYYPVYSREQKILGVGAVVTEITERKEAEKEIQHQAFHDSLTGLPNRKFFEQQLKVVLEQVKFAKTTNFRTKAAVLFLDIDRLKNINDTLGHDLGDVVIEEVAARLRQSLRKEDVIARWGGDEFVILLPEIFTNVDAERVAQKLLKVMDPPVRLSDRTLHISISIGIAIAPQDGEDIQALQKNADIALYRAKDLGRNRFEFYHKVLNSKASERLTLENDLRKAITDHQMVLYFQPILDLKTRKFNVVEALLRWQHPTLGLIEPNRFISIAEESGFIVPLGEWVIGGVCDALKKIHQDGLMVAATINVSARQFFEDSLVPKIFEILAKKDLDPKFLKIEVTESIAMGNLEKTKNKLAELKEKGVSVIIDDFGTGYSSLNYLKRFPIGELKIDKSFVRHCITDEQDTSIIKAIISMAKSLNLDVIAEGVNSEMQMSLLDSLGCDSVQGYYISRPLPPNELIKFLLKGQEVKTES